MIGQTLGHYRIESQLGAGGMGVVYRAYDTKLERMVAIKLVGERASDEPTAHERLLREARTASALNHPNVCTIHEVGEAEGQVYLVMELVQGRPLAGLLSEPRVPETIVRYGIQIAEALEHAHGHGIVHRDLKTSNVMLTAEGRVKVLDFGLAKRLVDESPDLVETRSTEIALSGAGHVAGTLHYLPPEVLRGKPADARGDIWALGVLLYELASADLPFQGKTRFEVTGAILGESPRPLPSKIPAGLRAVIERCLVKDPAERYQRASEVRAALEAIQSGSIELSAPVPVTPGRRRSLLVLGALGLVIAALAAGYWLRRGDRAIASIAVLPFANVGNDPDTEYLSDGIAESVIGSLSHLPRLKMIAFGSVLRYKGRPADAAGIARELAVDALVMGRVAHRSDGLTISAELIDAHDGSRIWGNQYDEKPGAALSVQQDISRQISDQLRSHLSGEEKSRVAKRYTTNPEAYDLYLKGRFYHEKFTHESYLKSLEFLRQAVAKDPAYAPAWAAMAVTYLSMTFEGDLTPGEGYPQVEAAVSKGRELDDTVGELYWPIGMLKLVKDWDWRAAEKEFQRGLSLDPQSTRLLRFEAQLLRVLGRWDDAIAGMRRAKEIDPLETELNKSLGATYYYAGRYDEAIDQLKKTLEIDPGNAGVHDLLSSVYERKGMFKEAIAEQQQAFALGGDPDSADALAHDFEALGYERVMRHLNEVMLEGYKEQAKKAYVSPMYFAGVYAKLGDKDQAFAWLDKAAAERAPWLSYTRTDPEFDSLRADPRFAALMSRIGLP
jgi:serine/threonine protein kinase/tetratricopeptide (TPR) repeat protein